MSNRFDTIAKCAQAAIDMQDACNLSGVLIAWAEMRPTIWTTEAREGIAAFNTHPINRVMAYKVFALAHGYEPIEHQNADHDRFSVAYDMCAALVNNPDALVFQWNDNAPRWAYKIDPGFQKQMDKLIGG